MTVLSYEILCGICHAPVDFRDETDPNSDAGCAACDNWADPDEVRKIAAEYAVDEGQLILNRRMHEAARESSIMTFTGQTEHDKAHRFIIKLEF